MLKNWSIRYDVRRMEHGQWVSCCMYPEDEIGFGTVNEARTMRDSLLDADDVLGNSNTYSIAAIAMHDGMPTDTGVERARSDN